MKNSLIFLSVVGSIAFATQLGTFSVALEGGILTNYVVAVGDRPWGGSANEYIPWDE